MKHSVLCICVLVLLSCQSSPADPPATRPSLTPDPVYQAAITDFYSGKDEGRWQRAARLAKLLEEDKVRTIQQAMINRYEDQPSYSMALLLMTRYFAIGPSDIVEASAPLLEDSNQDVRQVARDYLQLMYAPPDDLASRDYMMDLQRTGQPQPTLLIDHAISEVPNRALPVLANIYLEDYPERRSIWLACHEIEDAIWRARKDDTHFDVEPFLTPEVTQAAKDQLKSLSRSEHWWARRYVAEIVTEHPFLADPEVVEKLKADPHELVRSRFQEMDKGTSLDLGIVDLSDVPLLLSRRFE